MAAGRSSSKMALEADKASASTSGTKNQKMNALMEAVKRKRRQEAEEKKGEELTPHKEVAEEPEKEKIPESEEVKKARKAVLREAARAKERAETMGPKGYLKPPCLRTNKRFLLNTVKSTLNQPDKKRSRRSDPS